MSASARSSSRAFPWACVPGPNRAAIARVTRASSRISQNSAAPGAGRVRPVGDEVLPELLVARAVPDLLEALLVDVPEADLEAPRHHDAVPVRDDLGGSPRHVTAIPSHEYLGVKIEVFQSLSIEIWTEGDATRIARLHQIDLVPQYGHVHLGRIGARHATDRCRIEMPEAGVVGLRRPGRHVVHVGEGDLAHGQGVYSGHEGLQAVIVVIRQRVVDTNLGIVAPEPALPVVHGPDAGDGFLEGVLDSADVVVNLGGTVDRDPEMLDA